MSISYEEALETLQSMFGPPWTRDDLDAVLRHQQGHMENTVDCILRHHGTGGDPQQLIHQLQTGTSPQPSASPPSSSALSSSSSSSQPIQPQQTMDAPLAMQSSLGSAPNQASRNALVPAIRQAKGTPTVLSDDFLRLPLGYATTTTTSTTTSTTTTMMQNDEALARMLQDELFSEELARNPDFAHLARGGGMGGSSGAAVAGRPQVTARAGLPMAGGSRRNVFPQSQQQQQQSLPPNSPNIMKAIADLGDNARRRLQLLATQFNAARNPLGAPTHNQHSDDATGAVASSERRSLLDDDNDNMELAARKDL